MRMWIAVFAVLFSGVFPAASFEFGLPAIYEVAGISEDDFLNVRSGPSTSHPVIDGLPNGAQVEVTSESGDGWARILHGEGNGWVAMRYLQARSTAGISEELFCAGTEPFWGLSLEPGDTMTFNEMDQAPVRISPEWRNGVAGSSNSGFAVGSESYIALFNRRECSDGMSDRTYGWALDFLKTEGQGAYLQGCCRMLP